MFTSRQLVTLPLGLAALWLMRGVAGEAPVRAEPSAPTLTTVRAIRALSAEQANAHWPAQVHAVVTFYNPAEYWAMFVEDATGGMFVKLPATNNVKPGDRIFAQG